jgi:SNF2 family DNA or RNA helicase
MAAMLLKRNREKMCPCLYVCKSGLRMDVFSKLVRWSGLIPQVIEKSSEMPYTDIFDVIVVSVDTLRLLRPDVKEQSEWDQLQNELAGKKSKNKDLKPKWPDEVCAKFKSIFVDESQKIKNPGSARTQALRKIAAASNNGHKARIIPMSGTMVEKNASEFYVPLNLVHPEMFYNPSTYTLQHCAINPETGKVQGLKNPEKFHEMIKPFFVRRTRAEVMPELPTVFRQFRLAEIEGGPLEAYIRIVKEFQKDMEDPDLRLSQSDILGYLTRMRHITGIAKKDAALKFIEEFLLETEGSRKLVVFLHHIEAGAMLMADLEKLMKEAGYAPPMYLASAVPPLQRPAFVREFQKPENKIMLASTLAACEGLDMQFCTDCLIMERQWNPSAEEQAESRFPRPVVDEFGKLMDRRDVKINAHYLIAAGTMDDFMTDIIEEKRRNVASTLDGVEIEWDETSLQAELARVIMEKGLLKWKL